ncbi:MAG: TolC family protein, partial [bacterium]
LSYSTKILNEEGLIERALENNPRISLSEYSIKRLNLERKIAKNKMLPRLDLKVGYEDKFDKNTERFAEINSKDFQVTLNLIYTFQERDNSVFARAQQADIALSQERTRLVDTKRQIILDIRRIIRSIYANIQAIEVLKKNIEAANEKVRFATTMFNLGRASNLDITDAQQVLLRTEILYLKKMTDYQLLLAQLETLIGEPVEH